LSNNIIYLDVDGVLNPDTYNGRHKYWSDYKRYDVEIVFGGKYRIWLSADMCQTLLSVAKKHDAEIAWSTTWNNDANHCISPIVGFPELRVVYYDTINDNDIQNCGKLPYVSADVGSKNAVWIDDYLGYADMVWVNERHNGIVISQYPTLAIKPESSIGLTQDHIDQIDRFFDAL
jgi:hypothetical protein